MMTNSKQGALRLVLMAGAAWAVGGHVWAQDAAQGAALATEDTTEVTIVGRRPLAESDAAAMKAQKASDSLVSVLAADAIGDLPDQNIAFAVGRLPGVALERDQGQARYVNLRGMPRRWTTISFDGLSVVSAEGRDSRFDNIPSAIASQVTIQKAIVPSMPGDTVAGNIDIRTRRAFDYKGQKITGKIGVGAVNLGGGQEYDSSLVYSNIFMDGKLGLVAQASHYQREMATENWEVDPYLTQRAAAPGKRFAREFEYKNYRLTRYNDSASFRADYKLDDSNTIFASTIWTRFHDDELRDNFIVRLDQGTNSAKKSYNSDDYFTANDPTHGTVYGARANGRVDYRDSVETLGTSTIGGEHKWDDNAISWRVNHTEASNGADEPVGFAFQSPSTFTDRPSVVYDFTDPDHNTISLFRTTGTDTARTLGAAVTSIESFPAPMSSVFQIKGGELTIADTAKVDYDHNTQFFGHDTKLELGGMVTSRRKKSTPVQYTGTQATLTAKGFVVPTYGTLAADIPYKGKQELGYTFRYTDKALAYDLVQTYADAGALVRDDAGAVQNYWKVSENLTAAYAMATTTFDWGNLVYGVRVEKVENTGEAYISPTGTPTLVHTKSEDTLAYPSVHVNWNLTDDLKARLSLTSTASRPDYDDMRPNFTFSDSNQTVSGGNPDATPEKQNGFDAYLEWYPHNSFVMAGFFYKDIKDVLFSQTGTFGSDALNSGSTDRSGYAFTTLRNGGNGHLQGFEVFTSTTAEDFVEAHNLPDWLGGFGVHASATFADSEVSVPAYNVGSKTTPVIVPERKVKLPGTSDAVYNLQAIYEKYGLTVRLAYQYRTDWIQDIGAYTMVGGVAVPTDNGDIYWAADEEIDLSVRYQINTNLEWYADASNIGNQPAVRYGGSEDKPIEHERFGARYVTGLRFNF